MPRAALLVCGGPEANGSTGTIKAGPGSPQGSNEIWWQVQFADNLVGWVPEARLIVTDGNETVISKPLEVCVPVEWNKNRPEYTTDPNLTQIVDDCRGRVEDRFLALHGPDLPPSTFCKFEALTPITKDNDSCDADCPAGEVCT